MVSAIRYLWPAPGLSLRGLNRFLVRLLARDDMWSETLPDGVKEDLGLIDGRPSLNRNDAYWSAARRHGDWMRSGPL